MAKTYEELLEQAAVIRDETKANANTAKRVGGTIADIVERISEIEITGGGAGANEEILNRISEAKKAAVEAKTVASDAKATATQLEADFNEEIPNLYLGGDPTEWSHMNKFVTAGNYVLQGERTNANDGLPILNANPGHTIFAQLSVLDSSLTDGTGAKTDVCVTQVLRLSNRTGGDGHIYVRTGQAATKEELAAADSTKWGTWEKLMGIFEKNVVTSASELGTYTTNGMYSGIIADTHSFFPPGSTFLLITVNGYAVSAMGLKPAISQVILISAPQDYGNFTKMYIRRATWDASNKVWVFGGWDALATASELTALEARIAALEAK